MESPVCEDLETGAIGQAFAADLFTILLGENSRNGVDESESLSRCRDP